VVHHWIIYFRSHLVFFFLSVDINSYNLPLNNHFLCILQVFLYLRKKKSKTNKQKNQTMLDYLNILLQIILHSHNNKKSVIVL
jgi:hypothetical protein